MSEQKEIFEVLSQAAENLHNDREEWLMKFFGYYEAAEKYGKLFVLETSTTKVLLEDGSFPGPDMLYPTDTNVYRIKETNRLRPKTYLELHDEGLIPLCIEAEKDPLFHQIGKNNDS